ncbi:MAG: NAD-dependent epimerase/dehydratase family protein [Tolumonas sp.]|nr:NAD-dependent epimerase/dehydratase family protein [Tolumonas sp.]
MMRILITGISGYVGSHLANCLFSRGYTVFGLIRREIQDPAVSGFLSDIKLFSFNNDNLVSVISEIKPDVVIHLASLYLASHDYSQISELVRSNVEFPCKLLEAMEVNGVKKLINTGTSWQHYNSESYEPVNLYAATKQAFDDIVKYYTSAKGFSCITLKLFDTYGPNDQRGKLISLLDKLAETGDTLSMSAGEQYIEISHISDVCAAYFHALDMLKNAKAGYNEHFGVDSNSRLKLRELVTVYENTNGVKLNIKWGERAYREREVMQPCQNLKNIPGWNAGVSLQHGLKKENR